MPRPRICVVGASNYDLISYVPRLPKLGETLHGSRFQMSFGGKGANQAVMAARLGAQVSMVTKLGEDVFAADIRENYQRWGIDTTYVLSTSRAATGVAPIAVDSAGNNAIIIVMGANDLLSAAEIAAARQAISAAQVLVVQLEIPLETTLAAMRIAREAGVTILCNPAPAGADLPDELFALSDILCPNEPETELMTSTTVGTLAAAEDAARMLLDRGASRVILTLGERGSLLVTPEESRHVRAPRVQAVDTTGAGDAFVGSLAYFLAAGKDMVTAMQRANQIAALSVQKRGTQSSFPTAADLPASLLL